MRRGKLTSRAQGLAAARPSSVPPRSDCLRMLRNAALGAPPARRTAACRPLQHACMQAGVSTLRVRWTPTCKRRLAARLQAYPWRGPSPPTLGSRSARLQWLPEPAPQQEREPGLPVARALAEGQLPVPAQGCWRSSCEPDSPQLAGLRWKRAARRSDHAKPRVQKAQQREVEATIRYGYRSAIGSAALRC